MKETVVKRAHKDLDVLKEGVSLVISKEENQNLTNKIDSISRKLAGLINSVRKSF